MHGLSSKCCQAYFNPSKCHAKLQQTKFSFLLEKIKVAKQTIHIKNVKFDFLLKKFKKKNVFQTMVCSVVIVIVMFKLLISPSKNFLPRNLSCYLAD